jgi:REP element-mobilizing transposase RayT
MTAPRQVLEGTTYLVTRRCTQRMYLLRPSKVVNEVYAYVLALAAARYKVEVHAYCVMSNHAHLVVTDPKARLPAFLQYLDGLVGRALNALHGRRENFWASEGVSIVTLGGPEDVVAKAAYTLANPVAAGLVRRGREWPGLWSSPERIGSTIQVSRPEHFFSKDGYLPKTIGLKLTAPPGFSARGFREALEPALAALEAEAQGQAQEFLGPKRVLAQRPFDRPRTKEPRGRLNPRVAAQDRGKRLELIGRLKSFLADYREALAGWREKRRRQTFPAGTYLMRVAHGVPCAAAV